MQNRRSFGGRPYRPAGSWQKRRFNRRPGGNFGKNSKRNRFSEKIDVSKFIKKAPEQQEKIEEKVTTTFADFGFCKDLENNLKKRNFTVPTPIQDKSMKYAIAGRDVIGLANTGTGKTGAFLLPLINKVYKDKSQNVLIIAPTRELALQIENEFRQFSMFMRIFSAACVGGMPIYRQINNLRRRPNFVIGTPGRLKDLQKRHALDFKHYQNIVLDEVDRMMDMGFLDDIKEILSQMPENRQSLFFCATLPIKIKDLVKQFCKDPQICEINNRQTTANVDQDIIRVKDKSYKFEQLRDILSKTEVKKAVVFSETKAEVEKLANSLTVAGFHAASIHGDKSQHQRQRALTSFRNDIVNILVATDVAARGLDIKDVTHVINYTIPQTYDDYVHRIGRAGRYDQKGFALTFVE